MENAWITDRRLKLPAWPFRVYQARRQTVDPDFSGQAFHQEARGNPHGKGKGAPESGFGGQAGKNHV